MTQLLTGFNVNGSGCIGCGGNDCLTEPITVAIGRNLQAIANRIDRNVLVIGLLGILDVNPPTSTGGESVVLRLAIA